MYMTCADIGCLVSVCKDLLAEYERVPFRNVTDAYNRRCPAGCGVRALQGKVLAVAVELAGGELMYHKDGTPSDIARKNGA